ncbi:elongation factor Ts, partial [Patescibacteria group bacterium]
GQGVVEAYSHHSGEIGSLVAVVCETDFVAKTKDFKDFVHEVAMQVAATNPSSVEKLLKQPWIRDEKKTIASLLKLLSGKTGEKIEIKKIFRLDLKD